MEKSLNNLLMSLFRIPTFLRYITILVLSLSIQHYAYAQKKATTDSIVISTTQKASQPSLKENEYIIKYPNGTIKRIQDKLTSEEILWLKSAEEQGKKKTYDDMYNLLLNVFVKKEQNPQTTGSKLIASSEYSMEPAYYRWVTRRLMSFGYTLENIAELQQRTNINVFTEAMYDSKLYYKVLFSSLIVVGTIDSAYNDTSFDDGYSASVAITVKETLRGDTTIKHPIIRVEGRTRSTTKFQYGRKLIINKSFDTGSPHDFEVRGSNYIFFLYKDEYENKIYQWKVDRRTKDNFNRPVNIRIDPEAVERRRYCYKTYRNNIPLTKWGLNYEDSTENIDEVEKQQAEEIRKLCAEIAPILRQLNIK